MLRAEKGYAIVGQDTDGTVTPTTSGWTGSVNVDKGDFIGRRSLPPRRHEPARPQAARRPAPRGPEVAASRGSPARARGHRHGSRCRWSGHVTSSYRSAALGRTFALAMLGAVTERHGATVFAPLARGHDRGDRRRAGASTTRRGRAVTAEVRRSRTGWHDLAAIGSARAARRSSRPCRSSRRSSLRLAAAARPARRTRSRSSRTRRGRTGPGGAVARPRRVARPRPAAAPGPRSSPSSSARWAASTARSSTSSANRVPIELGGARRFELLSKGCSLDLDPRSWGTGRCAQTLLARVPVILHEREDDDAAYSCGRRSPATSSTGCLLSLGVRDPARPPHRAAVGADAGLGCRGGSADGPRDPRPGRIGPVLRADHERAR